MSRRSGEAQAAQRRRAGPMKHRNTPRGGSQEDGSLDDHDCAACSSPIALRDLVVVDGTTYHRGCVPQEET